METFDPTILYSLALILAVVGVLALLLLAWVIWTVRKIDLPADADFFTTLRATPFSVVLLLDLLDFAFDFLSAPIAWIVLSRLGLTALRGVSVVESVIPGTQFLPTMTAAWIVARFVRKS
ncbi:MAG: hypothetical protein R3264_08985 [Anaerolineae bacterium]|nr:hypothetical protein [Anaerolineae bacterium]